VMSGALKILNTLVSKGTSNFSGEFNIIKNEDGDELTLALELLQTMSTSHLLSAPRVTTMNNKPAVVADLFTRSFNTSVSTQIVTPTSAGAGIIGGGGTVDRTVTTLFSQYMFGIALSVTPRIGRDNTIRLWLAPMITRLVEERTFEAYRTELADGTVDVATVTIPEFETQGVWTNVQVADGDTLVMGGLVQDETSEERSDVPYLSRVPLIGTFFKNRASEKIQSSLLIFVSVNVIDSTGAKFLRETTE